MRYVRFALPALLALVAPTTITAAASDSLHSSPSQASELSRAQVENLVRRSVQYVALYDTLQNFTFNKKNPFASGGWNKTHYPEGLMDASVHWRHHARLPARPEEDEDLEGAQG